MKQSKFNLIILTFIFTTLLNIVFFFIFTYGLSFFSPTINGRALNFYGDEKAIGAEIYIEKKIGIMEEVYNENTKNKYSVGIQTDIIDGKKIKYWGVYKFLLPYGEQKIIIRKKNYPEIIKKINISKKPLSLQLNIDFENKKLNLDSPEG